MSGQHGALTGRVVVVTRPAEQAAGLIESIEREGGRAMLVPLLTITPVEDAGPLRAAIAQLERYDFAVFVSQNAVAHALAAVLAQRAWPEHVRAVTMGPASRAALAAKGITEIIEPAGPFDSETLLQHPALQPERVLGRRVVIFRGEGGRELLGDTLAARGAVVERVACYHRDRATLDTRPLVDAVCKSQVHAFTLTSSEAMPYLVEALGSHGVRAFDLPLFVPHERIRRAAQQAGWRTVVLTAAGDVGLLAGVKQYFANKHADAADDNI